MRNKIFACHGFDLRLWDRQLINRPGCKWCEGPGSGRAQGTGNLEFGKTVSVPAKVVGTCGGQGFIEASWVIGSHGRTSGLWHQKTADREGLVADE
jgi:hypothetical protein